MILHIIFEVGLLVLQIHILIYYQHLISQKTAFQSIVHTLCELNEYDPICEGGAQEGGDEASIHCEIPAS